MGHGPGKNQLTISYRPEIDGLRAVAVLPVIFFHAGFETFSGGFVGVDVFFVISGYLITSIILSDLRADKFSLVRFYENRARRILPALFLVLAVSFFIGWFMLFPEDMEDFSKGLIATVGFVSNFFFWNRTGYFDTAAELNPLLHTWSLAVEEQYYFLFPLFLMALWRKAAPKIGLALCALGVASLVAAEVALRVDREAAFFLLPFRLWELAIGGYAAYFLLKRPPVPMPAVRELAGAAGLALILGAVFLFDEHTPFPGLYAVVPTLGTALIILFVSPSTLVGRLLSSAPFVGVGLISYSAYLWHQPLLAFARYRSLSEPPLWAVLAICVITFVLAYFSWRFVEAPFRRKQEGFSRRTIFLASLAGGLCLSGLGVAGLTTDGFKGSFIAGLDERQKAVWDGRGEASAQRRPPCHFAITGGTAPSLEAKFLACAKTHGKAIVILGDSHAMDLFNAAAATWGAPFIVSSAIAGCRPDGTSKLETCHYDDFEQFLIRHKDAVDRVIYNQAGLYLVSDTGGRPPHRSMFRRRNLSVYQPNIAGIDAVAAYLKRLANYADVIWAGPWLEPHMNATVLRRLALNCIARSIPVKPEIVDTFQLLDSVIKERVGRDRQIKYVSTMQALGFDASKDFYDCDGPYWSDGHHWSDAGERRFGPRLEDVVQ